MISESPFAQPDLSVEIAGLRLRSPVIAASGCFGYGREYADYLDLGRLGAIISKGLTLEPRAGNRGIRIHETASGLMNSIGLQNPGVRDFIQDELPAMRKLGPLVIANLSGSRVEDYAEGAALLDRAEGLAAIELNISCPNVKAGGMAFGLEPGPAREVTAAVRAATGLPLIVKLSPNAPSVAAVARAVREAGADALSLVNTFSALAIDVEAERPVFDNIFAGLSGPCVKPLALRLVWEAAGAVDIPVIGCGGIASADDALEFILAGASAVEVGSATFRDPGTMVDIVEGLGERLVRKNRASLRELVGAARKPMQSRRKE